LTQITFLCLFYGAYPSLSTQKEQKIDPIIKELAQILKVIKFNSYGQYKMFITKNSDSIFQGEQRLASAHASTHELD
jgi:hypothetical protein